TRLRRALLPPGSRALPRRPPGFACAHPGLYYDALPGLKTDSEWCPHYQDRRTHSRCRASRIFVVFLLTLREDSTINCVIREADAPFPSQPQGGSLMSRHLRSCAVVFAVTAALLACLDLASGRAEPAGKKIALVVGINKYHHGGLGELQFAEA